MEDDQKLAHLTAAIVAAYVENNSVPAADLPSLINKVYDALAATAQPTAPPAAEEKPRPAVPVRRSVTDDYVVCLEDGLQFKSLRRHLMTSHGMTPEQYRERWSLRSDYPMVAPGYAKKRAALAKKMGLGRKRKR